MSKTNGELKIEKGIPIPAPVNKRVLRPPTPFTAALGALRVGESFLIKGRAAASVRTSMRTWARRHAPTSRFTTRAVDGGVRVWRTK